MAKKKSKKSEKGPEKSVDLAAKITEKLRVTPGFALASFDASSTPGFKGDKAEAAEVLADTDAEIDDAWIDGYLFSLSGPIYAGTNEIQRNVIAERLLGLPRGDR